MNVMELACISGNAKLVKYLAEELYLRSPKGFNISSKDAGVIDAH
jgi:hypothetical protein